MVLSLRKLFATHVLNEIVLALSGTRPVQGASTLGTFKPSVRLDKITFDAATLGEIDAKIKLRTAMPLLCGFAIPPSGFVIVLWNSLTSLVESSECELGFNIAGFSFPPATLYVDRDFACELFKEVHR
jgi:hypothetical protein